MVATGFLLIPTFGVFGALATYLSGRVAEGLLLLWEVRRTPAHVLPRRRAALLCGLLAALTIVALSRSTGLLTWGGIG